MIRPEAAAGRKDAPTQAWIDEVRHRFPIEPEMDRVYTRKLQNRGMPFAWPTLDEIQKGLLALLQDRLDSQPHEVSGLKWLSGGASKLQVYFDLDWTPPGGHPERTPMVLRMDPAASIQETSRRREFELLTTFQGVVPVPRAYWLDADAVHLPYPAMVSGFVHGVAQPTSGENRVSGLGAAFTPELRAVLARQFIDHLAAIHRHDVDDPALQSFQRPADPKDVILGHITAWERVWEEDTDLDNPLVRLAFAWLRDNVPDVDRLSVVHCDYRTGNYLFTEDDGQMTAILDWEGGHIGDRHEDLAYTLNTLFGSADEDGRFLTQSLLPEDEFIAAYEAASGLPVVPERLRFWQVYTGVKTLAITPGTAYRISSGKQTHQDVLVAWLCGVEGALAGSLRAMLTEVL
ncbi:MAG TPA: phosphotransferase family protein [Propionibacteriaceae bacterium]|jgi:aminoglycoside phosphotransferase (APT) family kinase protein|nr:phosphotransferase family protein [Propionibacteriaceae bacterium]HBY23259.1 phosphotransferase family protein [Propionibacteriaceae bacterium]